MKTVIEMAREAGLFCNELHCSPPIITWKGDEGNLERFAELVRADEREKCEVVAAQAAREAIVFAMDAEREACAKVVEASPSYDWHKFACEAAAAIRARGNT